jgi:hypothetical protein
MNHIGHIFDKTLQHRSMDQLLARLAWFGERKMAQL